jgi:hypothetical protein
MNAPFSAALNLDDLRKYLLTHGWTQIPHSNNRILFLETKPDQTGDFASVALPVSTDFSDATKLIDEAMRIAAEYENVPIQKMADRVHCWDLDIMRAKINPFRGHENSLPLGVASEMIASLKDFIGYAAYTQSNPQPFFDKAGAASASFAKHCRFGHTFTSSFGLTVECPVSIVPELPMPGATPAVPFERQVFERVATGLATLRASIESNSLDPMIEGFQKGFSANMCRALAEVFQVADGRRIEYDISWSLELKSSHDRNWKPFLFEGRAYEVSRAAASELEKVQKYSDSVIEGPIIVLKSDTPPGLDEQSKFEHIITMHWEREKEQLVQIRVPLSPQQYIQACDAHKDGERIRIFGVPEKSGKFWTLLNPHDFSVLPRNKK